MTTNTSSLKYDVIGSFLAPEYLVQAREEHAAGTMDDARFAEVQEQAFREVVERQIEAGIPSVTSGELRRNHWGRDFYMGLGGISRENITDGGLLQDEPVMTDLLRFTGRIEYDPEHPFFATLEHLAEVVDGRAPLRQTIPSPADLYRTIITMTLGQPDKVYPSPSTLLQDIAEAYNKTILRFYELGCRQIQLDDTVAGRLTDPEFLGRYISAGIDPLRFIDDYIRLINDSLRDLPADLVKSIFISGGNPIVPEWDATERVDNIMPAVLSRLDVDIFYLPFDLNNLQALEVLRHVAPGKKVRLGLVSAHNPLMENPDDILAAVDYASRFMPAEDISISPMTGFKLRSYITRGLSFADQWNKIDLLRRTAAMR